MKEIIVLFRVKHYVKNLFIFMPLFFAEKITSVSILFDLAQAFFAFSLVASSVYILNDICDAEQDRKHPFKKMRPIASGLISRTVAIVIMGVLILAAFFLMIHLSFSASMLMLAYFIMNVLYSFYLKHFAIVDVSVIATGFVLRIFVGSFVGGVALSIWIIIMTFLLALFLGLAKRRDDLIILKETGVKMRKVIDGYTLEFIDNAMSILAAVVIVSYILYTSSIEVIARVGSQYFPLTAVFVILGILRYMQITYVFKNSGSPTHIILTDIFLQSTLFWWVFSCAYILYK